LMLFEIETMYDMRLKGVCYVRFPA